jgi:hypothetical protein
MGAFSRSLAFSFLLLASHDALAAQTTRFRRVAPPAVSVRLDPATGTFTRAPTGTARTAATVSDFPNLDLSGFVGIDTGGGSMEWFNDGIKGASGNASDLMTSFVMPYCSAKLDPSLGGPGGAVKLGFYEGYTRLGDPATGAPNGTAVSVLTLTGLPAHTASSSFFGGFSCYFLEVRFPELVSFADGPIGYSWGFLDTGTDGILAGTFPYLASAASCSGSTPIPGDPLGQEAYTCCSARPADAYRDGLLQVVFTFIPYCYPFSMGLDVREVRDLVATASPFVGRGVNRDVLEPSPAIVGASWTPQVTLGHGHGSGGIGLLSVRTGTFDGPRFPSPIGGRILEVLICGPRIAAVVLAHDGVATAPIEVPLPAQLALVGQSWAAQATIEGGGFVDLSTAVSGVTGTQ